MKKLIFILTVSGSILFLFSCKTTHTKCDAYSSINSSDSLNLENQKKFVSYEVLK